MKNQSYHTTIKNNIITLYPKESKNNVWYIASLCFLIAFMIFHLFFSNFLNLDGKFPLVWIVLFSLTLIITITNFNEFHSSNYIIASYIMTIPMILNYFLFKLYVYIPSQILLILSLSLTIIYGATKEFHTKKHLRIIMVILSICVFFLIDYYIYSQRIIKDSNLNLTIKKSIGMDFYSLNSLDKNSLLNINTLKIKNVSNLEGLEYIENLNALDIIDDGLILDYSPITKLDNLKTLSIYRCNLNVLSEVDLIEEAETFQLMYPKTDSINSLPLFPNVKNLTINFSGNFALSTLKNFPSVEEFSLCLEGPLVVDGIEVIDNLKTLNLSYAYVSDYSKLFDIPTLEAISLKNCYIVNLEDFIKQAEAKGIKVIM
ncbi:hypothetical protein [uncultured Clostridium sp.]|uniref:hypothetical protein n=1 Tax=uncultured Clostridium sp. TaxID=59620 RepID=UPI00321803AA